MWSYDIVGVFRLQVGLSWSCLLNRLKRCAVPRLEDRKPDGSPKTGHMRDVLNHVNLSETVGEITYQHLSTSINYILQDFRRISSIDRIKHT